MIVKVSRILVTGGAGLIGCSLVTRFMNRSDHHVAVYDNLSTGSKENILPWFESPRFKFIFADMKIILPSKKQSMLVMPSFTLQQTRSWLSDRTIPKLTFTKI
jgi:nucleoside-diphosphate-sugar epimerase